MSHLTNGKLEDLLAIHECEQLVIEFCDLMDEGEVEAAVALHTEDAVMIDAVTQSPLQGREAITKRLKKVRFSHADRKTLHTPTNIRVELDGDRRATGRFVVALYDLVEVKGGRGIGARSTELMGFAYETVVFVRTHSGKWLFEERALKFLSGAKQMPIGVLPSGLPFEADR